MPALTYFAAKAEYGKTKLEVGIKHSLAAVGLWMFCLLIALETGRPLLQYLLAGQLCWYPSRYTGQHCTTFLAAPWNHTLSLTLVWGIFWLSAAIVIGGVKYILSSGRNDG